MKSLNQLLILVVVGIYFNGCAALFHEKESKVAVNSDPQKVKVYIDGMYMGETPLQVNLANKHSHTVQFKRGSEEKTYILNNHVGAGWVILDVLGLLIPVVIDAATESWYDLETDQVNASFEK